jgi:hypothetical protein
MQGLRVLTVTAALQASIQPGPGVHDESSRRPARGGRMRPMVLAAALIALLSGCAANPPDPCSLLTLEELQAGTGVAYGPGTQVGAVGSVRRHCLWVSYDPAKAFGVIVDTWRDTEDGNWGWFLDRPGAREVAGLGERAVLYSATDSTSLWVRHAGRELQLDGSCAAGLEPDCANRIIELTRKALARLP